MAHRIGLVGLSQAQSFVDVFNAIPDTEVTAICDIDEDILQRVGEEKGIHQRFRDYEDLMDSDVNAVVLSTPIQVHGSQSIEALKTGKHVLSQYIAASDPEEANELLTVWKQSNRKYMTIETDCFERRNLVMRALADKGVFGELTMGRGHYLHDCKTLGYKADGSLTWRGEIWKQGHGGQASGVHTSLPLIQLFNDPIVELYSYGPGPRTLPEFNWSDRITTAARLESGRTLEFVTDVFSWHPTTCGYYVQGTKGYFSFRYAQVVEDGKLSEKMDLDELEKRYELGSVLRDRQGHMSAWTAIIEAFVDSINRDKRPPQDLYDALQVTAIGWAVDESLETGQPAKVLSFA